MCIHQHIPRSTDGEIAQVVIQWVGPPVCEIKLVGGGGGAVCDLRLIGSMLLSCVSSSDSTLRSHKTRRYGYVLMFILLNYVLAFTSIFVA